jgi:hypothetical protein
VEWREGAGNCLVATRNISAGKLSQKIGALHISDMYSIQNNVVADAAKVLKFFKVCG